jgi:hypothetical protein
MFRKRAQFAVNRGTGKTLKTEDPGAPTLSYSLAIGIVFPSGKIMLAFNFKRTYISRTGIKQV